MKTKLLFLFALGVFSTIKAQVGINNTNPKASLDITATNAGSPSNTDGLLIPRIDVFPSSDPSADQQGMMVYLTTTSSGKPPGFYYWDNNAAPADWVSVVGGYVEKIDDLSDGKSDSDGSNDGSSIFLGVNAGGNDNGTDNKNVGIGYQSISMNNTGYSNTALGYQSLMENTIGHKNTAIGSYSLSNNTFGNHNTANGDSALYNNTSGESNTAMGNYSLFFNTTGNDNAAIGYLSLSDNTTGTGNTAMGSSSLNDNTTGNNNTAVGSSTLLKNTTGDYNTAIGQGALVLNTTGYQNTALGRISLYNNTTGFHNTAIGYSAGYNNVTGSNNVFLGRSAGWNETGSDKLYIENSQANSFGALIYGEFDNNILRTNGEFQIGNPSGTGYKFPTTDGTLGQTLITDGSGQLTFSFLDSSDHDWYEVGTTDPPNNIGDNKYTLGNVGIGLDIPYDVPLHVYTNSGISSPSAGVVISRYHSNTTSSGNGGISTFTDLQAGSTGWYYNYGSSLQSLVDVGGIMYNYRAVNNVKSGSSASKHYLYYGIFSQNTGTNSTADRIGSYIGFTTNTTSNGDKYGHYTTIPSTAPGTHFGIYSDVTSASGYAGYFLGRTSLGTGTSNRYLMPTADGTAGQVMTTDGSGQLSFSDASGDADWFIQNTTNPATSINDNIYTMGNVSIGNTNIGYPFNVTNSTSSISVNLTTSGSGSTKRTGIDNVLNGTGHRKFGIRNSIGGTGGGEGNPNAGIYNSISIIDAPSTYGIYNSFSNNNTIGNVEAFGAYNWFQSSGIYSVETVGVDNYFESVTPTTIGLRNTFRSDNTNSYGVYNTIMNSFNNNYYGLYSDFENAGTGNTYGAYSYLRGSGSGDNYGYYALIHPSAGGTHYGIYSNATDAAGYAGYFLGRVSIGTTTSNNYILPSYRGNSGYVLQSGGGTTTSWVDPSSIITDTDNQTIDVLNLSGTNLEISLEDDGVATQTLDLSSLQDGIGTDDQNIQNLNFNTSTNTLTVGIENGGSSNVNLSALTPEWTDNGGFLSPADGNGENVNIGSNTAGTGRLNIARNSTGTAPQLELKENQANDGARINFTNNVETTNLWTIYARTDNNIAESIINFFHTTTGNVMHIRGDGRVGINDTAPAYALELPNNGTATVGQARANAWNTYSDSRVKKEQQNIKYGLTDLLNIKPMHYTHYASDFEDSKLILDEKSGYNDIGFIAQELYYVIPEAVQKPENENKDLWSVNYEKVIPVAVQAIKELNIKVENLEAENQQLKKTISKYEDLEKRLSLIESNSNKNKELANH